MYWYYSYYIIIDKTTEGSPDLMVLTTEVRINPQLQPQEVEVIFQTDGIAQEGNVTVTLELEPLLTTTLPMGEAVFFQKYIDMIIIDTDSENVSAHACMMLIINIFSLRYFFYIGSVQNI